MDEQLPRRNRKRGSSRRGEAIRVEKQYVQANAAYKEGQLTSALKDGACAANPVIASVYNDGRSSGWNSNEENDDGSC